ncbi:uncharacterized protein WCC33_000724 [Rhinophrynus dorsalis]
MSRFFLLPLWRALGWETWDSSIPYNWTTPWFYQDVGRFVRENQLEGVKPEMWTPKVIYKLIRAKDIIETISGLPAATSKMVWQNVSSGRLTNRHKDTAWMAIQGGLSLRSFMHARNLCRYRHCSRGCVAEETALHVFWQCPFAQALLDDLENELKDSVPKRHLSYHSVLYGLFPGTHSYGAIQEAWRIMCCVKDALWVLDLLTDLPEGRIIVGGDFNLALDPFLDSSAAFNEVLTGKQFPTQALQAHIVVLPKPNKDRSLVQTTVQFHF